MYHSITFTKGVAIKNTWDDFHLIPSSRPDVTVPQRTLKYVDIPGKSGSLDLSDYLTGGSLQYSDRSGSWEFIVIQDYEGRTVDSRSWVARKAELTAFFDGSVMNVTLEDNPGYYYKGRVTIDSWKTGQSYSAVTVNYRFHPYKFNASNNEEAGI
jgi:hypothetical protein